jgi:hypothetical protein
MSRGAQAFKQGDVTKAIKAAVKSGISGWRVELVEGKIIIRASGEQDATIADERALSEWD